MKKYNKLNMKGMDIVRSPSAWIKPLRWNFNHPDPIVNQSVETGYFEYMRVNKGINFKGFELVRYQGIDDKEKKMHILFNEHGVHEEFK